MSGVPLKAHPERKSKGNKQNRPRKVDQKTINGRDDFAFAVKHHTDNDDNWKVRKIQRVGEVRGDRINFGLKNTEYRS